MELSATKLLEDAGFRQPVFNAAELLTGGPRLVGPAGIIGKWMFCPSPFAFNLCPDKMAKAFWLN